MGNVKENGRWREFSSGAALLIQSTQKTQVLYLAIIFKVWTGVSAQWPNGVKGKFLHCLETCSRQSGGWGSCIIWEKNKEANWYVAKNQLIAPDVLRRFSHIDSAFLC